ncbi:MAG TPA: methylated-DNA--[protein]-cysteine S-methyltransferase [Propionicimonas sp.]|nr:methylated-DNA--[protein]-cysteine S-methyltransferase [Propionicimonas sp.]HRA05568.1 methylated-DNA--[protein]-cysteine S-methyltransferase [Propionicimonas sp.]
MKLTTMTTPDGPFTMLVDAGAVLASGWTGDPDAILHRLPVGQRPATWDTVGPDDRDVAFACQAVAAFYAGDVRAIDSVPVRQSGTQLRRTGWLRLREIPPGEPLNYTGFAAALGHPTAVRAAASICATNAPALFVPCHRVLRSDGSLGGFAWGLDVKASLLLREAESRRR